MTKRTWEAVMIVVLTGMAAVVVGLSTARAATDALDEVNAARTQMGLAVFQRDEALTQGAMAAADYRAANGIGLHTYNDFAFLPAGSAASGSGTGYNGGPLNCCYATSNYPVAGAAYATGNDGVRRIHIFVSTRFNVPLAKTARAVENAVEAVTHPVQTMQQAQENRQQGYRRGLFGWRRR